MSNQNLKMKHELIDCTAMHDFSIEFKGTSITGVCSVEYSHGHPLDFRVEIDQLRILTTDEAIAIELYVTKNLRDYYSSEPKATETANTSVQSVLPLLN